MSHLLGLHPFALFANEAPALLTGARKVIESRLAHGGGGTGWSRAWIINFFARLRDGDAAREQYLELLRRSTLPNLFDVCPPFQIDGNFGAVSGLCEMLLQSHERVPGGSPADQAFIIDVLPALPKAWPEGAARGLTARGGFVIDLAWKDGKLTALTIHAQRGGTCRLRLNGRLRTVETRLGSTHVLSPFTARP